MKTLFIVLSALTVLSLSSCKKQYACECTSTYYISGGSTKTDTQVDTYSEKMKESQAKAACSETETKVTKVNNNYVADVTSLSGTNVTSKTSCSLK